MARDMSTDTAFQLYGYGITDSFPECAGNVIYNTSWPVGNQCTVDHHRMLINSAQSRLRNSKPFRIDYHTGDTVRFMAWCNEMHINCDNDCSNAEFRNRLGYEMFKKYPPVEQSWIGKLLFRRPKQMTFNTFELPRKCKWMWWNGNELEIHETYLGLTDEQIAEVENYLKS